MGGLERVRLCIVSRCICSWKIDDLEHSTCGAGGDIASTKGEGAEYCQYRKPERGNKVLIGVPLAG